MKRPPGTGSIEQRGDQFRARLPRNDRGERPILRLPDGTTLFATPEAAAAALDGVLALMARGRVATPSSVTLRAFGERYMAQRAEHGSEVRATVRGIRQEASAWRAHVSTAPFAERPIDTIERAEIKAWIRQKLTEPAYRGGARDARKATGATLSRKTVGNLLHVLRVVLAGAVEDGLLERNPAADVKVPIEVQERELATYVYPAELVALFVLALPDHVRAGLALALYTGLRRSSVLALEWADVDLDAGVLVSRKQKRGRLFRQHLLPEAVKLLRWWKERAPAGRWVFTAPHAKDAPARPYQRDYDFGFAGWREAAGITRDDPRPTLHSLRHTCAVALLGGWWGRRWSLDEVRDHLSHASVTITERYLHWVDESAAQRAAETAGGLAVIPGLLAGPEVIVSASAVVPPVVPGTVGARSASTRNDEENRAVSSVVEQRAFNRQSPEGSRDLTAESVDTGDQPPPLRARMVAFLTSAVAEGTSTGDLEAARIAHDAVARLLGSPASDSSAGVVDLASERARRQP